jgi:hypothetical protein
MLDKYKSYEQYIRLVSNTAQTWQFYLTFMLNGAGGTKELFVEWAKL